MHTGAIRTACNTPILQHEADFRGLKNENFIYRRAPRVDHLMGSDFFLSLFSRTQFLQKLCDCSSVTRQNVTHISRQNIKQSILAGTDTCSLCGVPVEGLLRRCWLGGVWTARFGVSVGLSDILVSSNLF